MVTEDLPLATRLWFAWLCFFRVLFDGRFAARAWAARELPVGAAATEVHKVPAAGDTAPTARGAPAALPKAAPEPAPAPGLRAHAALQPARASESSRVAEDNATALQLLGLLQREGRFVDFLQQDIAPFPDADVGVAARVVHEGCRRALRAHASLEPVRSEAEGARVTLAPGFRADEVKLVGDVKGEPPYAGVVRHRGWRATRLELPKAVCAHDPHVLAPAEVEL